MKLIKNLVLFLLAFATISSCSDDDDQTMALPGTITDIAVASPSLTSLVAALQRASLDTTLDSAGDFTVFAPTNAAFETFLNANNFPSVNDVPVDILRNILLNHVIGGALSSNTLTTGYVSTLATQEDTGLNLSMFVNNTSTNISLNGVSDVILDSANIPASNGIIHVVDAVIGLPTIATHATANSNFSELVGALSTDLVTTLSSPGTLTVLAPDNAAFTALGELPTGDALTNVLLNHVIGANVPAATLIDAGSGYSNTLATGAGNNNLSIYFDTADGVVFNGASTVSTADVICSNGIIHAVDAVILPPTIVDFATSNPALSSLVAALTSADSQEPSPDLIPTLSGEGTFTVFAPTNDAFSALLLELDPSGETALENVPPATVEDILLIHVAGETLQSTELVSGPLETLNGTIDVNTMNFSITDERDRSINIVTSLVDIQATNGVVHVVDRVILPEEEMIQE